MLSSSASRSSLLKITLSLFDQLSIVALGCMACLLFATTSGRAQSISGTLSGTVTDATGAVIAGANVILTDMKTGASRRSATNTEGRFTFPSLAPDPYSLTIDKTGFDTLDQKNILVTANENVGLGRVTLKTGQVTEVVEVKDSSNRIDTESSDLTTRLTSDQIALIPVKGRDITSLLRVLPGTSYDDDVEAVGDGFGTNLPNFSGARGRSGVATMDGLNAAEPSGSNKVSMTINQDAISEVKVLRNNYGAEYGNNGGAIINIVTKSGGQQYHGGGYYYLRNEALNANDFLRNNNGTKRPLYRHNIWGVNLGGPVQIPWLFPNKDKNKLFFFYSYEKPHTITPQDVRNVTVPTGLERQGDFSQSVDSSKLPVFITDPLLFSSTNLCQATPAKPVAGTNYQGACFRDPSRATAANPLGLQIIPKSRFNASGLAILNFFPLPNASGRADGFNYITQRSVDVPKRSQVARFDLKPTEKDTISAHTQQWTSDNEGFQTSGWPGGSGDNGSNTWGIGSHYLYKDDGATLGWVHLLSERMVNEMTVGIRHDTEGFIPSDGVIPRLERTALGYTAPQLFPANNILGTIPRATGWSGVNGRPANINWLDRWGEVGSDHIMPSVADNFSFAHGVHALKFGMYYEHLINTEAPGGNWSGTFNFGNSSSFTPAVGNTNYAYANALIGNFNSYSEDSSRPFTNLDITLVQWYGQDEWKIKNHFTLNYGVRFGYHTQLYQRDQLASNFVPSLFDPAKSQVLWQPLCVGGPPANGTNCSAANSKALNPVTGAQSSNLNLVGTLISGLGNPLDGIQVAGKPGTPPGFKTAKPVDIEPRLGFAWDTFGTGRTVLRAMAGVYHSPRAGGGTTGGNLVSNAPFQTSLTVNNGNIDNLVNLVSSALANPTTLNGVAVNSKTPTIYDFSLGIQQDLGKQTVMEVEYVGSLARFLGVKRNINGVPDGARFLDLNPQNRDPLKSPTTVKNDNFLRPFQGFGTININSYDATSSYNGLQVSVNRRYANNYQFGIAYTYSKTLDYAQDDDNGDVKFPRPFKAYNYAVANFDQTHIFTANYIVDLPKPGKRMGNTLVGAILDNWQVSGLTSLVSGKPKSVTVSYTAGSLGLVNGACPSGTVLTGTGSTPCNAITDFTGGTVNANANITCDPNQGVSGSTATGIPYVINTSCFVKPAARGDLGSRDRNVLRLPGLITTDLAVMKNFHTTEKTNLQFRWEVYNLFNHTNFSDIDAAMTFSAAGVQTNTTFGAPKSVRPARVMQGSLRFSF